MDQGKRILQIAFQQDEWLHPDSSYHSLSVPHGPVWTGTPCTSGTANPAQNKLKTFPVKEHPKHYYLPISPCIYLSVSHKHCSAPAARAGEIPLPMAETFHLTAQFYSLFSLAFHLFSLFFSTLFRELRAGRCLEPFCGSSGELEEPSPAGGQLSQLFLSPWKTSGGQVKGVDVPVVNQDLSSY